MIETGVLTVDKRKIHPREPTSGKIYDKTVTFYWPIV